MDHSAHRPPGTQAIQRAASVLRDIAANNRTGLRLVDLVTHLGLEQPTTHRIVRSLIAENLVQQEASSRRYFLGRAAYEFGLAAAYRFGLRDLCQASLSRIAEETGDTICLTSRNGAEAVCLDRKDGKFPIKVYTFTPGDRRPLGIGAGSRSILSVLPPNEITEMIRINANRLRQNYGLTPQRLFELVHRDQQRGYTLYDVIGSSEVKALALPIRNHTGEPFAALSISGLTSRIIGKRLERQVELLRTEVRSIELLLNQQNSGADSPNHRLP